MSIVNINHNKVPCVEFDKDYFYMPASIMPRTDITQETKLCFAMILTEYLPSGYDVAQKALADVTVEDIFKKYNQPLLMAGKIREEIVRLAPELEKILDDCKVRK